MPAIAQRLARLLHASRPADLPSEVLHEAKRALVNWMGAALGGSSDESVMRALATFAEFAGPPQATVIGREARADALTATLVNGISSNILDFDDTHARIVLHPTASIACALLALSEIRPISGMDFLHALVLGIEVEARAQAAASEARGTPISHSARTTSTRTATTTSSRTTTKRATPTATASRT